MAVTDLLKSFRLSIYDRVVSPLFGTFLISWLVINYRLIFVLISDLSVSKKFTYIDETLYPTFWPFFLHLIFGPLLSSVAFIWLYPHPARWAYKYWRNEQRKLKIIMQEIENEAVLTQEDAKKLRRQFNDIHDEYQKDLIRRDADVERYKSLYEKESQLSKNYKDELNLQQEAFSVPSRIYKGADPFPHYEDLESFLTHNSFKMCYDVERKLYKKIGFSSNGKITVGKNKNESAWRIVDDKLEFISSNKKIHSRFTYIRNANLLISTDDPDTVSSRHQFIYLSDTHDYFDV